MRPYSYQVEFRWQEGNENRNMQFHAEKIIYDEGGDNSIRIEAYLGINEMEILDKLEKSKNTISFSFEPDRCSIGAFVTKCSDEVRDYYSDDGKATLSWILDNDKAIIHLHRIGGDSA